MPSRVKAPCKRLVGRPHGNRGSRSPICGIELTFTTHIVTGVGMSRRRAWSETVLLSCVCSAGGVRVGDFAPPRHRRFAGREPIRIPPLCEATGSIPRAGAICFGVHKPLATHRREIARLAHGARREERNPPTSNRLVGNAQFMVKLTKRSRQAITHSGCLCAKGG
jgi:hypothetical protein